MLSVCLITQSCLILCNPMDHSPPGSSGHRVLQATILSGLPFSPPGDLLDLGIKLMSPVSPVLQVDSLPYAQVNTFIPVQMDMP